MHVASVWAIWLLVGPHMREVDNFCRGVVSVTVDMGTERIIGNTPNVLPAFATDLGLSATPGWG